MFRNGDEANPRETNVSELRAEEGGQDISREYQMTNIAL